MDENPPDQEETHPTTTSDRGNTSDETSSEESTRITGVRETQRGGGT